MREFYKKRPIIEEINYEQSYWGETIDPDGVVRNKKNERLQYLSDIKQELDYINSFKKGKVLDVGCGLGFLLSGLNDNFEKYGIEVSALACENARQYGNIFNGTLEEAGFEENFFDIVVMYHVIEHIDSPESVIKTIKSILKNEGTLVIGTPDFNCICAQIFKDNFRMLHDKTHTSLFSYKSLKSFLENYGFEVQNAQFPYFNTRHFTSENIKKMLETSQMSPPFYGNVMTLYCKNLK